MQRLGHAFLFAIVSISLFCSPNAASSQEPPSPASTQTTPSASSSSSSAKPQKYSHANDFLMIGTVFDPKGFALPGVELRIRRINEKKYRWDTYTNSRGEFAVRVPQGKQYEVIARAKGFADQSKNVDAKTGLSEERMVFHMEPMKDRKP